MKKRFVVALDSSTPEQQLAFQNYVKSTGAGWWHWLDSLWLLIDTRGQLDAIKIRDKLCEIFPRINNFVIELRPDDDTWAGYGPKTEVKNMFTWLKSDWIK